MKKVFLMMAVAVALSFTSCTGNKDYKAQGEELSKQLDEQVEKQDTSAVLASDDFIRQLEAEIEATGDTAAIAEFRAAMKDARVRNATFITMSKIRKGMTKKEVLEQLMGDALKDNVNITAVTSSINAILKAEAQNKDKEEKKK